MDGNVKDCGAAQSADELFDVVDEHDRVVGQARRAERINSPSSRQLLLP
jgi:hypothetical protein